MFLGMTDFSNPKNSSTFLLADQFEVRHEVPKKCNHNGAKPNLRRGKCFLCQGDFAAADLGERASYSLVSKDEYDKMLIDDPIDDAMIIDNWWVMNNE